MLVKPWSQAQSSYSPFTDHSVHNVHKTGELRSDYLTDVQHNNTIIPGSACLKDTQTFDKDTNKQTKIPCAEISILVIF